MVLLITPSHESTLDAILARLAGIPVFLFHPDRWREYAWNVGPGGFTLQGPDGRVCHRSMVRAVFRWETSRGSSQGDSSIPWEVCQVGLALAHWARTEGRLVLGRRLEGVAGHELRYQSLARAHFRVPDWRLIHDFPAGQGVVGMTHHGSWGLSSESAFGATKEEKGRQAPCLLRKIPAVSSSRRIALVWVAGSSYAFEAERNAELEPASGSICLEDQPWRTAALSSCHLEKVSRFFQDAELDFACLELLEQEDVLWFLALHSQVPLLRMDPTLCSGPLNAIIAAIRTVWLHHP